MYSAKVRAMVTGMTEEQVRNEDREAESRLRKMLEFAHRNRLPVGEVGVVALRHRTAFQWIGAGRCDWSFDPAGVIDSLRYYESANRATS